jgi:hypothetical protein
MASISGSIQMLKESLDMDDVRNRLMDINYYASIEIRVGRHTLVVHA